MINNRQNGRRRGRGGGQQRQGGGGQGQRDSGNRIDSRARGNAAQLLEKYRNMARDAQMAGDRVNTEYYLQFADHYFRVLADQRGRSDDQPYQRRQRDDFDNFDDGDDFGDEGEPIRADEQHRVSEIEPRRERDGNRRDEGRSDEGRRDEGRREARDQGEPRREGRRDERRPQRELAENVDAAPRENGASVSDVSVNEGDEGAPRRRRARKPRDEAATDVAAVNGAAIAAEREPELGIDRLPPALGVAVEPGEGDEPAVKPRRRRVRAAAEATPAE
ncbi:DUF4167 domain-containing protein [Sphingomonas yunnanensis]|uniref:DUF4167 domain-containing protein n=1 Tax=Sphingomonas yunnanensis TaxID=310400 RepID=UPI001CA7A4EF|nr:DUF4167 domain-containing protein [Sphingomonas yunnanensis]MBY9065132.1 DUF4167 domain-containing protein [Sphingomonas yunnanensis]